MPSKYHCQRCRKDISEKKYKEAVDKKKIPLCDKCQPIINEKLKKWGPKFLRYKF